MSCRERDAAVSGSASLKNLSKANAAASVHQRLLDNARKNGRPFNEVLQYFKVHPGIVCANYPAILDLPAPTLRIYPPETVVAEKVEAMVRLGSLNSRAA